MTSTTQDPILEEWTTRGPQLASATDVNEALGRFLMSEIPPYITPFLAAAGAELALIADIDWRFGTDVPAVGMVRLIARVAIVAPHAGGLHTQRLADQLEALAAVVVDGAA